jgi:D-lyxose ketol-isomerase
MHLINEPVLAQSAQKIVAKVWGTEFWLVNTELYCMKFLKVNPGFRCSIHAHAKKDETFIGWSGVMQLNIHDSKGNVVKVKAIHPGEQYHIWPEVFHSFQAVNLAWVMEVSTFHSDKDVVRISESLRLDGRIG